MALEKSIEKRDADIALDGTVDVKAIISGLCQVAIVCEMARDEGFTEHRWNDHTNTPIERQYNNSDTDHQ